MSLYYDWLNWKYIFCYINEVTFKHPNKWNVCVLMLIILVNFQKLSTFWKSLNLNKTIENDFHLRNYTASSEACFRLIETFQKIKLITIRYCYYILTFTRYAWQCGKLYPMDVEPYFLCVCTFFMEIFDSADKKFSNKIFSIQSQKALTKITVCELIKRQNSKTHNTVR